MSVFSSYQKQSYFATVLSSKLMLDDPTHYIMASKVRELASSQPGYLGSENGSGEIGFMVIYWQTKRAAKAWLDHDMQRRFLSIGESFWYEEYSVKLVEVLDETQFRLESPSVYASRFPRITTKRGVLRVLDESQAHLLHDYVNQEKKFLSQWEPARSESYYSFETCLLRVREIRRDFLEDKGVVLCFLSPNEDKMIAYTNYSNFNRGICQTCNLGYSLRQCEQGKGLMHEALSSGLEYVQKELNISRIQASYMPRNAKSAAVLKRVGFEKEGVAKEYLKINSVWEDHILTALTVR